MDPLAGGRRPPTPRANATDDEADALDRRLERRCRYIVLYELNVLHRNTIKGWWTWVADLFAASLLRGLRV